MAQHPDKLRWREELHFGLSASEFGKALGFCGRVVDYVHYRRTIVGTENEFVGNVATFHGIRTEPKSRTLYEMLTGNKVYNGGFFTMPDRVLACSPDGQVFYRKEGETNSPSKDDTKEPEEEEEEQLGRRRSERRLRLLEIKSPFHALYGARREENKPFGIPLHYMCQLQGQMAIANADECDFFIYLDSNEYCAVEAWRVYKSDLFWAWAEPKLRTVAQWIENGLPLHTPRNFSFAPFDFASLEITPLIFPYNITLQRPLQDSIEFAFFDRFANPYNCANIHEKNSSALMQCNNLNATHESNVYRGNNYITDYKYKNDVIDIVKVLQSPVVHFLFGKCDLHRGMVECNTYDMCKEEKLGKSEQCTSLNCIKHESEQEIARVHYQSHSSQNNNNNINTNKKKINKSSHDKGKEQRWVSEVDYCIYKICTPTTDSTERFVQEVEKCSSCKQQISSTNSNRIACFSGNDDSNLTNTQEQADSFDVVVFRPFEWDSGNIYIQLVYLQKLCNQESVNVTSYRLRAFHRSVFISLYIGNDNSAVHVRFPTELLQENEEQYEEELLSQSHELICEEESQSKCYQDQEKEEEEEETLCCAHTEYREEQQTKSSEVLLQRKNNKENEEQNEEIECVTEHANEFIVEFTSTDHKELFASSTCLLSSQLSSSSSSSSLSSSSSSSSESTSVLTSQIPEDLTRVKSMEMKTREKEEYCHNSTFVQSDNKKEKENSNYIHNSTVLEEELHALHNVTSLLNTELQKEQSKETKEELQHVNRKWISYPQLMELLRCSINCNEVIIVRDAHLPVQYYPFGGNVCDDLDNGPDSDVEEIVITDNNHDHYNNYSWEKETFTMLVTSERILSFICAKLSEHISNNTNSLLKNNNKLCHDDVDEVMHLSVRMYVETLVRNLHSRQGKSKLWQRAHNVNNLLVCCIPNLTSDKGNNSSNNTYSNSLSSNKHSSLIKRVGDIFNELQIPCLFLDVSNIDDTSVIFDKITQSIRYENNHIY